MKLVVIYGPPGIGKLTVAKELSKLTDHKVLHNHLTIDMLESVLDRGHQSFWSLLDSYRVQLIEAAAKENVSGIILTTVNIKDKDDAFIKDLITTMNRYCGSIHFVKLECNKDELRRRIKDPSREKFRKITDFAVLEEFAAKNDMFSQIPFVDSLKIDNTSISAQETAKLIQERCGL